MYLETPVSDELTLAAASVPLVLGFDRDEGEIYLTGNVLQISWVADESTKNVFGVQLDDDCEYPATMLRLDYEAWALPGDFNAEAPDRLSYRREHIYVRASVLRDEEVYCYGLGPEYGFDHWAQDVCSQGSADEVSLPKDTIPLFVEEIENKFEYKIDEYLDESPIPKGLFRSLMALYRKTLASKKAKATADVHREQVIRDELSGQLIELDSLTTVNDITNGFRIIFIDSKTGHFRFRLQFQAEFSENQPVTVTVSKAKRVYTVFNYKTVSEKELVCPIALQHNEIKEQFKQLALINWPATEFAGEVTL